ncbi:MAG: para-aminobenzoate synthetase component 1 [Candidatus Latescibacterota bacterium]
MRRFKKTYKISLTDQLKKQLLSWAQQFEEIVWLDSNNFEQKHQSYQAVLAVDAFTSFKTDFHQGFEQFKEYQSLSNDWLFGYLAYDMKNDVERMRSMNFDGLGFPDIYFFQPKRLFLFTENEVEIQYLMMVDDALEYDWEEIMGLDLIENTAISEQPIKIKLRTSKDAYFEKVSEMLHHINRGDIYEANFCQEFYAEDTSIDPLSTFLHLNEISQPPFATFLKFENLYGLSASPERYIKKEGSTIISQPIKGTAKRDENPANDLQIALELEKDPKERSENIMITDLVRNDLSKIAKKSSVVVDELCKVYSFKQVHQLVSTIRCEVDKETPVVDIIRNTFPMGSMTGAPKVSAMKIIEALEDTKRGLYSGTVGYFTPTGDFDFNVIIRSILYNESRKYVSFSVGGAITSKSVPEKEYEECLLKAKAMREALER